jgi:PIF1-like helicase/Helicase
VDSVKYITKYVFKGHDRTTLGLADDQDRNEIKEYLDARYIGSVESCWHIFEFPMHAEKPTVYRLPVHLEDQQLIYFNADDHVDDVLERGATKETSLTAWFKINQSNPQARNTTYQNFPQTWVYDAKKKAWTPRQRGHAIGRMYFAAPSSGERFYLRLLLTVVPGATSFAHLRTVNNVPYDTFKEACFALGLLEDDREWIQCLTEAGQMQIGYTLRMLFATIIFHCNPTSPGVLWNRFKHHICDDLLYKLTNLYPNRDFTQDEVYDYGLHLIDHVLRNWGTQLSVIPGMPQILGNWGVVAEGNRLINEQMNYNRDELGARATANTAQFNNAQREIYDAVMESVNNNNPKIFFLHSAGGCGKTFVCNTIAAAVRAQGKIVLCVASSGIASLLLEGGRTAHSTFKIPLQVNDTSFCNISRRSDAFPLLRETSLIVWDEVPMQHKYAVDAVNRTIQDLLENNSQFGGITVLFGGDFRQTLPVIPHGLRQQIVAASLRRSSLWQHVQMHYLHQNMRLEQTPEMQEFALWLLEIGAGKQETIAIPQHMICPDINSLIDEIYPGIKHGDKDDQYFLDRSILACTNDIVMHLNSELLEMFPGNKEVLLSADSVQFDDPGMNEHQPYSPEYLNSLVSSSLPLAHLALKVGCPIMLLRNLDPLKGLCNGTRLRVVEIRRKVLKCRIVSSDEKFAGKIVFIPRITLAPTAEDLPMPLRRRQFPVRLAFAMTINKSQGQSLKHVGLDLRSPVFSHGQLYVGLSRCTSGNRVKVLLKDVDEGKTSNIVYKEALTGLQL